MASTSRPTGGASLPSHFAAEQEDLKPSVPMKTDHPIYLFLSAGAEAFRVLTGGRELVGPYRFCSLTIKGLERRLGLDHRYGHIGSVQVSARVRRL